MATKPTTFQDVFDQHQYDLKTAVRKSRAWFDQEATKMTRQGITPPKVMKGDLTALKTGIVPGKLYMFMYDPKLKAELPYYDKFPLVFPFRKVEGGFLGLNMHYLPYQLRVRLLDRLMAFQSNSRMDETTRIKYSWAMIDGVSKYAAAKPCVKHYLAPHVRSQFRLIPADDWATAMMLPVERFVGSTKEAVWLDSKRKIG
jgi:hypothetical protein